MKIKIKGKKTITVVKRTANILIKNGNYEYKR